MKRLKSYFYWLPSALMLASSAAKAFVFSRSATPTENDFALLQSFLVPLAILEAFCVLVFLFPKTRRIGFLLVCSYWGGAIAVDLISHLSPITAIVILSLFWIGMFLNDESFFGLPFRVLPPDE